MNRRQFIKRNGLFITGTLAFPNIIRAGSVPVSKQSRFFNAPSPASSGGGGGNAYTFLVSTKANAASVGTATTPGVDTTGAKLIVTQTAIFNSSAVVVDSSTNVWIPLTQRLSGEGHFTSQLFYCINPTGVGPGHTFSGTANYIVICVLAFSCTGTPVFDAESGSGSSSFATIQPGSLSATGTELFVAGISVNSSASIDSSFSTPVTDTNSGIVGAIAYKNSSTAENPTWTVGAASNGSDGMATFK